MSAVPELERSCNSWIATSPSGRVYEFYRRRNVEALAARGWRVETANQYLCRINAAIKEQNA